MKYLLLCLLFTGCYSQNNIKMSDYVIINNGYYKNCKAIIDNIFSNEATIIFDNNNCRGYSKGTVPIEYLTKVDK